MAIDKLNSLIAGEGPMLEPVLLYIARYIQSLNILEQDAVKRRSIKRAAKYSMKGKGTCSGVQRMCSALFHLPKTG